MKTCDKSSHAPWPSVLTAILILVIAQGCGGGGSPATSSVPPTSSPPSPLVLFDSLWGQFDLKYSFFELKGIDWEDSKARFRSRLSTTSSDSELYAVLSEMLLELEDPHVRLDTPIGVSTYTGWYDQYPANFDETIVTATYLGQGAMMTPNANMVFGLADTDIGYFRVHSLAGSGHGSDTDFMLSQMAGIRGLVIDLRGNGGGNDQNGREIAARFADTNRLYRRVRFREGVNHGDFGAFIDDFISSGGAQSFSGPIAVLTNRGTISSAESLVLAFDVLPNTTSYGDFTGGGSANPEQITMANGWKYTVSRWIEYRPDGSTFEGVGIAPDVRIDISAADSAALRDSILDSAIAGLKIAIGL